MSVTAAKGFEASGVAAGIRREGKDLALVRATTRATGAAVWTRNRVQAAPIVVSKAHLELAAEAARLLSLDVEEVLVLSTGVIGELLPLEKIRAALPEAAAALSALGGSDAAEAILTTDTRTKQAVSAADGFAVGGMAKGSGMIHPNLATMLAVVTTDYPLEPGEAIEVLRPSIETSFNSISVDGECSTNDAVVLLSSGAAALERTEASDTAFGHALQAVCADLAAQIVADGEGATLVAEISVSGAASGAEARAIAQRIATSPLVKTALFGRDANWGRVLMAAGSAPYNGGYARLDPARVSLVYNGTAVLSGGAPLAAEPPVDGATCTIELDLGLGDGRASYLTSDLSYDYVRINADYRS